MDKRIQRINEIQGLVTLSPDYADQILWSQVDYDENYWLRFTYEDKSYALYLEGYYFCYNQPYKLYFLDSDALEAECCGEHMRLIKEFDENVDETEAKTWAEEWLLKFLKQQQLYIEELTYREIFSQAYVSAVSAVMPRIEVKIGGKVIKFKTEQAFEICKGLKWFACGDSLQEIKKSYAEEAKNPTKRNSRRLLDYSGALSAMKTAAEALGFSEEENIDELVNKWLDSKIKVKGLGSLNIVAANIIKSILNQKNENELE